MDKDTILELIETAVTSAIVILVIYTTVAMPEQVQGASMEPNFYSGERILVEKITKHFKDFNTGEVVVLHPPDNNHVDFIKRIVAVPGDIVKIYNCKVYINRDGQKYVLEEPYLSENTCTTAGGRIKEGRSLQLEEGEYLVLGDNRPRSADSRVFGLIQKERIVGRVVFRFWPLSQLGYIN
jgi:signal peptidase I